MFRKYTNSASILKHFFYCSHPPLNTLFYCSFQLFLFPLLVEAFINEGVSLANPQS